VDSYWYEDRTQIYTDIQIQVSMDFKGNVTDPDGILLD
jgi:hypothetical protein